MSERHLIILTKIILFYSVFVLIMKIIFLFQQYFQISETFQAEQFNALAMAQAVLMLPFIILAVSAFLINKKKNYSWIFVLIGAAVIIAIRAFEVQLLQDLQQDFLS